MLAPLILLFGYILYGFLGVRFDSPWAALRHLAAFPNCRAARAVGRAPTHDADHDGIACEPWHGASASSVKVHRYWRTGR